MRLESTINKEKRKKKGITQEEKKSFLAFRVVLLLLFYKFYLHGREREKDGYKQLEGFSSILPKARRRFVCVTPFFFFFFSFFLHETAVADLS